MTLKLFKRDQTLVQTWSRKNSSVLRAVLLERSVEDPQPYFYDVGQRATFDLDGDGYYNSVILEVDVDSPGRNGVYIHVFTSGGALLGGSDLLSVSGSERHTDLVAVNMDREGLTRGIHDLVLKLLGPSGKELQTWRVGDDPFGADALRGVPLENASEDSAPFPRFADVRRAGLVDRDQDGYFSGALFDVAVSTNAPVDVYAEVWHAGGLLGSTGALRIGDALAHVPAGNRLGSEGRLAGGITGNGVPDLVYYADTGEFVVYTDGSDLFSLVVPGPEALSIDDWQNGEVKYGLFWVQAYFDGKEQWAAINSTAVPDGAYHIATYSRLDHPIGYTTVRVAATIPTPIALDTDAANLTHGTYDLTLKLFTANGTLAQTWTAADDADLKAVPLETTWQDDDAYESNSTVATAYDLSTRENTWLSAIAGQGVQSEDDWYNIAIEPRHEHLLADLTFTHAAGNIDLQVTDAAGRVRAESTSSGDGEHVDVVLPAGAYFLRVFGANAGNRYDLRWQDQYLHPGDANLDGKTDIADLNIWQANRYTSGTSWATGDFNFNGKTDASDLNVWNAWKFTAAPTPAVAAPRPGDLLAPDQALTSLAMDHEQARQTAKGRAGRAAGETQSFAAHDAFFRWLGQGPRALGPTLGSATMKNVAIGPRSSDASHQLSPLRPLP